jgi:hypothetical protein
MSSGGMNSSASSRSNSVIDEQLLQQRATDSRSNSFADASEEAVTAATAVAAAAGVTTATEPVTALLLGDLRRDDTHAGCWLLRSQVHTVFVLCANLRGLYDALVSWAQCESPVQAKTMTIIKCYSEIDR